MHIIKYLISCVALVFAAAYAGEPNGSAVDKMVGLLCVWAFVGLIIGITSLIAILKKRRKKKKGIVKKDYLSKK